MPTLSGRGKGFTEVSVPCRGIDDFYEEPIVLCAFAWLEFQISVTPPLTVDLTIRLRMATISSPVSILSSTISLVAQKLRVKTVPQINLGSIPRTYLR